MRKTEDPTRDPASEARDDWADIERELDESLARSLRDWRPLPGDPEQFYPPTKRPPTETDDEAGGQA